MSIELLVAHFSSTSILIPLILAIIQWRKLPVELILIRWILIFSLVVDATSLILMNFRVNTHPLGNAYLLVQFTLLFWTYSFFQEKLKAFLKILFCGYVLFYLVNLIFFQSIFIFNTNSNVVASFILIFLALAYFYKLMHELPSIHVHELPMLWISFAILAYYSGTLFLFLASNYFFRSSNETARMMWILHNLLNITKNILFAIALWHSYRRLKSSISSLSAQ